MIRKKFDKDLFEKNDKIAREAMLLHLGDNWTDNPDKYGPDLIHKRFSTKFREVEIKRAWKAPEYPYETINLPQRKGKWKHLDIRYYILNQTVTHAVEIRPEQLTDDKLAEIPNRFVPKGEFFYKLDIADCNIIELNNQPIDVADINRIPWVNCKKVQPSKAFQMNKPFRVKTKDGVMSGQRGDWLMEDILGNRYICRYDVFDLSYKIIG